MSQKCAADFLVVVPGELAHVRGLVELRPVRHVEEIPADGEGLDVKTLRDEDQLFYSFAVKEWHLEVTSDHRIAFDAEVIFPARDVPIGFGIW